MGIDRERLKRSALTLALPALAVLVTIIGVVALFSTRHTSPATVSATATATTASPAASPTSTTPPRLPGNDWLQYRADTAATGVNDETIITPSNVGKMTQLWKGPGHVVYMGAVAVVGNVVYAAEGHTFFAHDLETGKQLWEYDDPGGGTISSSVAVDTQLGLAFYGTPDAHVYAVNLRTHQQAWSVTLGDATKGAYIWSSPLLVNGHVYIGLASQQDHPCVRGGVFALDEQTGATTWTTYMIRAGMLGAGVWSSVDANPARHEIIATTGNPCPGGVLTDPGNPGQTIDHTDAFVAMDWDTGKVLWQYTAFGTDDCDCDFGQGPVYLTYQGQDYVVGGNKNGNVYAVRPPAGGSGPATLAWQQPLQISVPGSYCGPEPQPGCGGVFAPPTYQNGVAYIAGGPTPDNACPQGAVNAIRVSDGNVLWRQCTSGQVASAPVLSNGMLFVAQSNKVVAYDARNGHTLWSASYKSEVWGGLALAHGHLIVPMVAGYLLCFAVPGVSP